MSVGLSEQTSPKSIMLCSGEMLSSTSPVHLCHARETNFSQVTFPVIRYIGLLLTPHARN